MNRPKPLIGRLCIIGVGLIGGSLARALREVSAVGEVVGCGRNEDNLKRAVELGVIDRYEQDPAKAVQDADVVMLAVPMGSMYPTAAAIADHLPDYCVLTDAGSSKGSVVGAVRAAFGGTAPVNFVPGHPIAGTEKSGVEASFPELYQGRRVILTPLIETDSSALELVRSMWTACGAEVVDMGVRHHDEVLAATSHLPHVLAYALVDCLARMDDRSEIFRYAAGGFRDFTRIASSHPEMWRDICVANRGPLLEMIEQFSADLARLSDAISNADSDAILTIFQRAKHARDNLYQD